MAENRGTSPSTKHIIVTQCTKIMYEHNNLFGVDDIRLDVMVMGLPGN